MRRHRRGANAVEFALVVPAFVVFIFGILEYSWVFFTQMAAEDAVRYGCRAGASIPAQEAPLPQTTAESAVMARIQSFGVDCGTCTLQVTPILDAPDEMLMCRLWVPYQPLTGLLPAPQTLGASSFVLLEIQR